MDETAADSAALRLGNPVVQFFSAVGLQGFASRAVHDLQLTDMPALAAFVAEREGGIALLLGDGSSRQQRLEMQKGLQRWEKEESRRRRRTRQRPAAHGGAARRRRVQEAPALTEADEALLASIWNAAAAGSEPQRAGPTSRQEDVAERTQRSYPAVAAAATTTEAVVGEDAEGIAGEPGISFSLLCRRLAHHARRKSTSAHRSAPAEEIIDVDDSDSAGTHPHSETRCCSGEPTEALEMGPAVFLPHPRRSLSPPEPTGTPTSVPLCSSSSYDMLAELGPLPATVTPEMARGISLSRLTAPNPFLGPDPTSTDPRFELSASSSTDGDKANILAAAQTQKTDGTKRTPPPDSDTSVSPPPRVGSVDSVDSLAMYHGQVRVTRSVTPPSGLERGDQSVDPLGSSQGDDMGRDGWWAGFGLDALEAPRADDDAPVPPGIDQGPPASQTEEVEEREVLACGTTPEELCRDAVQPGALGELLELMAPPDSPEGAPLPPHVGAALAEMPAQHTSDLLREDLLQRLTTEQLEQLRQEHREARARIAAARKQFREEVAPHFLHRLPRFSGLPPCAPAGAADMLGVASGPMAIQAAASRAAAEEATEVARSVIASLAAQAIETFAPGPGGQAVPSRTAWGPLTPYERILLLTPVDPITVTKAVQRDFPYISAAAVQGLLDESGLVLEGALRDSPTAALPGRWPSRHGVSQLSHSQQYFASQSSTPGSHR